MIWRIAPSLAVLRDEVNARWPGRSKASDGVIGDAAHAATASDHNPNVLGDVCAFDITHDPNGPDGSTLFALLLSRRHPTSKYLIWNRTIVRAYDKPGLPAWTPSPYTGADPHTNHVHVSVGVGSDGKSAPGSYDDLSPWLDSTTGGSEVLDEHDPIVLDILKKLADLTNEGTHINDVFNDIVPKINDLVARPVGGGSGAPQGDIPATVHFP